MKSKTRLKLKLRAQNVCERYDVVTRTVDRWVEQGILPTPMVINGIRYWDESELDRRDQERMAEARQQDRTGAQAGDVA